MSDSTGSPSPMNKKAVAEFFDRLAPDWDKDEKNDEAKLNYFLDIAGIRPGVKVLDVACGTGILFPYYIKRCAAKVTGVDISPEMIKVANGKITDRRCEAVCGDIESMEPHKDYDCAMVYNALPHFADTEVLAAALAQWLKPNGRLTFAHDRGIRAINHHHEGLNSDVVRLMPGEDELKAILSKQFYVDVLISKDDRFIISGTLLPNTEGEDL